MDKIEKLVISPIKGISRIPSYAMAILLLLSSCEKKTDTPGQPTIEYKSPDVLPDSTKNLFQAKVVKKIKELKVPELTKLYDRIVKELGGITIGELSEKESSNGGRIKMVLLENMVAGKPIIEILISEDVVYDDYALIEGLTGAFSKAFLELGIPKRLRSVARTVKSSGTIEIGNDRRGIPDKLSSVLGAKRRPKTESLPGMIITIEENDRKALGIELTKEFISILMGKIVVERARGIHQIYSLQGLTKNLKQEDLHAADPLNEYLYNYFKQLLSSHGFPQLIDEDLLKLYNDVIAENSSNIDDALRSIFTYLNIELAE